MRDAVLVDRPTRVGDTVRRPQSRNTGFAQRVLRHLEAADVPWAPRALGIDEEEREVLSWIPGETAATRPVAADARFGADLAGFLHALHALSLIHI